MTSILDNPIWNALLTGNKHLAFGSEQAKYLKREVGLFAGLGLIINTIEKTCKT